MRPLEEILEVSPNQWNGNLAHSVYHHFKIQSYIVDPNYLLAVHIGAPEPITPTLVTDYIWEKNEALWKLAGLVGNLLAFAKELNCIACLHTPPKGNFFHEYLHALLSFFTAHTGLSIWFRSNCELELRLFHPKTKKSHAITCKPDFHIVCGGQGILVGEVANRVGRETKSSEKDKHMGGPPDCPFKTVRVEAPSDEVDETLPDEEDETLPDEKEDTLPDKKEDTLPDDKEDTLPDEKEDTLPDDKEDTLPDDKGDTLPGSKRKIPTDQSEDSGCPKHHFRALNSNETEKMKSFLPQLVAGMLCSLFKNGKKRLPLGRGNENVQLGFFMEGFKLRFVRLVLRGPADDGLPDVHYCLCNPNLHCDVFITKEYNLFKQKHLGMFFHMLVAMYHSAEL